MGESKFPPNPDTTTLFLLSSLEFAHPHHLRANKLMNKNEMGTTHQWPFPLIIVLRFFEWAHLESHLSIDPKPKRAFEMAESQAVNCSPNCVLDSFRTQKAPKFNSFLRFNDLIPSFTVYQDTLIHTPNVRKRTVPKKGERWRTETSSTNRWNAQNSPRNSELEITKCFVILFPARWISHRAFIYSARVHQQ